MTFLGFSKWTYLIFAIFMFLIEFALILGCTISPTASISGWGLAYLFFLWYLPLMAFDHLHTKENSNV